MTYDMTMLDLVNTVTGYARSEAEVIATVVLLVNSGAVRLCGNFKGMRFEDALCGRAVARGRRSNGDRALGLVGTDLGTGASNRALRHLGTENLAASRFLAR